MANLGATFNRMFKKRRSFANGLLLSCSSVGSMSLPYVYGQLIETYTVRGTQLVMGKMKYL